MPERDAPLVEGLATASITQCSTPLGLLHSGAAAVLATSPSEENRVSRRPSVVVMQPIEDRVCDDTTICLGCSRHGLFLPKALVWPSLVEEADGTFVESSGGEPDQTPCPGHASRPRRACSSSRNARR